ncbi:hypothetical protein [Methanosarcina sp. WH1]|nr:hypothetical protein [Methanosarcina sp. WH1]
MKKKRKQKKGLFLTILKFLMITKKETEVNILKAAKKIRVCII